MPVVALRYLKVDLFPTLSDQVCCSADEYLKGWFSALGMCPSSLPFWKPRKGPMNFPIDQQPLVHGITSQ